MAVLQLVNISKLMPERDPETNKIVCDSKTKEIVWVSDGSKPLERVPQVFFANGEPWLEANHYALEKLSGVSGTDIKTVTSTLGHLKNYACWLEDVGMDWRHFPKRKKDRCLFSYRGYLVNQRDTNQLAQSTVSARMSAVVRFYRWCYSEGMVGDKPLWEDSTKVVRFFSTEGFRRSMGVVSSELSIPNRKRSSLTLEDGLLPISGEMRDKLLSYLAEQEDVELRLMLAIGFFTGSRSQTIRTLRLRDIENAISDSQASIKNIAVGPPTTVKTKFSVSGQIPFPVSLLEEMEEYFYSPRRLKRQALADKKNRTVLFLTSRGNPYSDTTMTKIMSDLRKKMKADGIEGYQSFHFHQGRATFGTHLMSLALESLVDKADAICFVRDAMLHKDEATTWKYVKFIERKPLKEKFAGEFYNLITGKASKAARLKALEDHANG